MPNKSSCPYLSPAAASINSKPPSAKPSVVDTALKPNLLNKL